MNDPDLGNAAVPLSLRKGGHVPDIVDLILAEHRRIQELLGQLVGVAAADPGADRLETLWTVLAQLLEAHVDTEQEIAWPSLFQGAAGRHLEEIAACHGDIREAVGEARFYPAGSAVWSLAVRAARTAAIRHIDGIESGPLVVLRRQMSFRNRELLGAQWLAFQAARAEDLDAVPDRLAARADGRDGSRHARGFNGAAGQPGLRWACACGRSRGQAAPRPGSLRPLISCYDTNGRFGDVPTARSEDRAK